MQITEITPKRITQETERLAAYCRVSSNSTDQLHSFAAQIRYYSDYVRKNPKYELIDIYADEGISGTEMEKRDELNRLLRDCKKGKIDRIITKSVSRFARNTEEMLIMLRLLKEQGVSVYFEEQGIDTNQLNLEMIVTFPGMTAQQESASISGNLRWGIQKKMEMGEYVCPHPPYGYILENKQLVVYEPEAVNVRRIYDLYLQGMSAQSIAELFNREAVVRSRQWRDKEWNWKLVLYILTNEKYKGDAIFKKRYTTDSLPYRRKWNKGEKAQYYVEQYCPAIISKEKYCVVQELIASRHGKRSKTKEYVFTKIIRCPDCGRTFRRQEKNGKAYWMCSLRASNSGGCKSRRIREDMAYETFSVMTYKLKSSRQQIIESTIQKLEYLQSRTSENRERIQEIDKEIADLSAKNHVITRLYTSGVLGVTEYTQQTSEIGNKITALRSERRKKLIEDETDMLLDELKTLNEIIKEYQPRSEFDSDLFSQIIEKIIVEDSTKLTFCLIGGLKLTEEIKEKGRCKTA